MESGAVIAGEFRGVEGMASVAAGVASVAGFVDELAGVVAGNTRSGAATDSADRSACGDPLREFSDACLDGLAVIARLEAATAAVKVRLVDGHVGAVAGMQDPASGPEWVKGREMATVAEVACVLTIGERAAGALIGESQALTGSLPAALDALQAGEVSWQNARVLVDETTGLDPAATAALEAHFLNPDVLGAGPEGLAGGLPPARLRGKVRSWRERLHPESIEARHAKGMTERRMECTRDRDGMSWLSLHIPADRASAIWNRTTAIARGMQGPDEPRTLTQLRPDIAVDLLLGAGFIPAENTSTGTGSGAGNSSSSGIGVAAVGGGDPGGGIGHASVSVSPDESESVPGAPAIPAGSGGGAVAGGFLKLGKAPAPRAQVLVMVPVFSLLGATDEPAILDGHGPIPASMARKLVAEGAESFYRVLVDPRDGAPLEIGRTSYRVSEALRRWLRLRDGKCPFPGCSNNSLDNEADHLLAWQHGGSTGGSNLGQPCPKHHRMKHTSGWQPTPATMNEPPGWISPAGRYYASEHQDWQPPHWPPGLLPHEESSPPLNGELPGAVHALAPAPGAGPGEPLPVEPFTDEDPLFQEPPGDHMIDEDDLPPDHEAWDILYTMPITLPPGPYKDPKPALT
ncbi:HNH endonuclease signature motif containing protein [Arthrobacter sp. AD-310]